jgi:hypothetical protein
MERGAGRQLGGLVMKTLMTLVLATGALVGAQALTAQPAEAFGWCGWRAGCCKVAHYRPAVCGCRHYRVVRHYRARRCCR